MRLRIPFDNAMLSDAAGVRSALAARRKNEQKHQQREQEGYVSSHVVIPHPIRM